ncbi:hypothetical protein PUN28_016172 [Cardiocondyla obscurior]|uniref:Uncharacterized protein n=1 Tax=Cardiocondyla obscurior TaxID=286306 RepID=A0AAW2ETU4_9HYME
MQRRGKKKRGEEMQKAGGKGSRKREGIVKGGGILAVHVSRNERFEGIEWILGEFTGRTRRLIFVPKLPVKQCETTRINATRCGKVMRRFALSHNAMRN